MDETGPAMREVFVSPTDLADLFESALGAVEHWARVTAHDETAGTAVLLDRASGTSYPVSFEDVGEHLQEYLQWATRNDRDNVTVATLLEYGDDDDYDALLQFTVLGDILY